MKKYFSKILLCILCLSFVACNSNTTENSSQKEVSNNSAKKTTLRVGVTASYMPWCYTNDSGDIVGIDPTILEEICKRNDWEIEYNVSSFDGMFGALDTGKVDTVAQQISATPARAEKYQFSEIYAYNPYKLYVHKDSDITGMEDMKGHSFVCQPNGGELEYVNNYKEDNDPNDEIEVIVTESAANMTVATGKADAACWPIVNFDPMLEETGYELKMVGDIVYNENNVYPFRKNADSELVDQFNKTLIEMKEDGFLSDLYNEYFGTDLTVDGVVK